MRFMSLVFAGMLFVAGSSDAVAEDKVFYIKHPILGNRRFVIKPHSQLLYHKTYSQFTRNRGGIWFGGDINERFCEKTISASRFAKGKHSELYNQAMKNRMQLFKWNDSDLLRHLKQQVHKNNAKVMINSQNGQKYKDIHENNFKYTPPYRNLKSIIFTPTYGSPTWLLNEINTFQNPDSDRTMPIKNPYFPGWARISDDFLTIVGLNSDLFPLYISIKTYDPQSQHFMPRGTTFDVAACGNACGLMGVRTRITPKKFFRTDESEQYTVLEFLIANDSNLQPKFPNHQTFGDLPPELRSAIHVTIHHILRDKPLRLMLSDCVGNNIIVNKAGYDDYIEFAGLRPNVRVEDIRYWWEKD